MVIEVSMGRENCFGEQPHESVVATRNGGLTDSNPGSRSDERQVRQVAIRPHCKGLAPPAAQRLGGVTNERSRLVIADERMLRQIRDAARCAVPIQILLMCVEPQLDLADAPCDQQFLSGTHHSYRNVGFPAQ